jgi:hypothetical protein
MTATRKDAFDKVLALLPELERQELNAVLYYAADLATGRIVPAGEYGVKMTDKPSLALPISKLLSSARAGK